MNFDHVIPSAPEVRQILPRPDGSEVQIVARQFFNLGCPADVDVFVLRRETPDADWRVLSKLPHPDWRTMSVDEYVKRGRSEMLQHVTHGEIFKAAAAARAAAM